MDKIGTYELRPFTNDRQNIVLVTNEGKRRHNVLAPLEIDVTKARAIIKNLKEQKKQDLSFTGWIITCLARAISDHKQLNAYRIGRKKIALFDDVDVSIPVERDVDGTSLLMAYLIRQANKKNVVEITQEIRSAQHQSVDPSLQVLGHELTRGERWVLHAPLFIKKFGLLLMRRRGFLKKKHLGTVGVTAIGMKGRFPGWVIPMGGPIATLLTIGGITKKPGVIDETIQIREYLHLTIAVDHDIVDGAPFTRFVDQLVELMESGYGLPPQ